MTTLREKILRELEQERIQLEHEKVQSEIRKNDAEAEKMEAEEEYFKRSWIRILLKYSIAGMIITPVIIHLCLDTFKILYDLNSYRIEETSSKIEKLKLEKDKFEEDRLKLEKQNNDLNNKNIELGKIQARILHENEKIKTNNENLKKDIQESDKKIKEFSMFVRVAEERYLETMMRLASANSYNAYVQLVKRQEIYLNLTGKYASEEKAQHAYTQACQSLHDYWKLLVKIAEETQADLFPEVKAELSDWLRKGELENVFSEECRTEDNQQLLSPIQRKSLDLIERHVAQIRAGNSQFPDDLLDTFIDQPEFL